MSLIKPGESPRCQECRGELYLKNRELTSVMVDGEEIKRIKETWMCGRGHVWLKLYAYDSSLVVSLW